MTETKRFELRVLLTVTTGRLLTKRKGPTNNGIGDLYDILGWMTNDSPFTHQLPRFGEECQPWLLRWFPELASIGDELPHLEELMLIKDTPEAGCEQWLAELCEHIPNVKAEYDVPRIPRDDHEVKNAYDELVQMRGSDEGIVVVQAD